MSSAPFYKFFYDNTFGNPQYDLSPYDYNAFVAANGRAPSGAEDFQSWQVSSFLRDHNMTPQSFLSSYGPSAANGSTLDSSGDVQYKNYGDGLGEFLGVPALFGGLMMGANAFNGFFNEAGAGLGSTPDALTAGSEYGALPDSGTMGVSSGATYNPATGTFSTGGELTYNPATGTFTTGAPGTQIPSYGYLSGYDPGAVTQSLMPGGSNALYGPSTYVPGSGQLTPQLVNLGGTGGVPGVDASLGGIPGIGNLSPGSILSSGSGLTQSGNTGQDGGIGGLIGSTAPGLAALAYARSQPGIDTSQLSSVLGQLQGNQNAVIKAATDPINQNIAAGYGALTQSLGNRGVLGSSFGNTDLANFLSVNNNTLGNAGANAAQSALGLQGNLAGNLAMLQSQGQQIKNNMYGRAFDLIGRGMGTPSNSQALSGLGNSVLSGIGNFVNPIISGLGNSVLSGIGNFVNPIISGLDGALSGLFGGTA